MVKPFGSTEFELCSLDMVCVKVQGLQSKMFNYIEVWCGTDNLLPMSDQMIETAKGNYEHLKNLPLADTNVSSGDLEVDILIGANYVWEFTT